MNTLQLTSKSDIVGALASTLCLVHCLATPFLFVAQAGIAGAGELHPQWWGILDLVFLVISFFAIWWSAKTTSQKWMRNLLWGSWGLLALIVLNEKIHLFPLAEQAIYFPSIALIFFHLYNRKYCKCSHEQCSTDEKLNA